VDKDQLPSWMGGSGTDAGCAAAAPSSSATEAWPGRGRSVMIGTDSATEIPLHFDSFLLCLLCVVGGGVYMACQRSELWR
jgi:hypothetical protein